MAEGLADLIDLSEKDKEFLRDLDSRCYELVHDTSVYPSHTYGNFHDVKVSKEEVERALEIVRSNGNLVFIPTPGSFGFHPAFAVVGFLGFPGIQEHSILLHIDLDQLPEGYDFKRLSQYFSSEDNLRRAKFSGIKFDQKEETYWY